MLHAGHEIGNGVTRNEGSDAQVLRSDRELERHDLAVRGDSEVKVRTLVFRLHHGCAHMGVGHVPRGPSEGRGDVDGTARQGIRNVARDRERGLEIASAGVADRETLVRSLIRIQICRQGSGIHNEIRGNHALSLKPHEGRRVRIVARDAQLGAPISSRARVEGDAHTHALEGLQSERARVHRVVGESRGHSAHDQTVGPHIRHLKRLGQAAAQEEAAEAQALGESGQVRDARDVDRYGHRAKRRDRIVARDCDRGPVVSREEARRIQDRLDGERSRRRNRSSLRAQGEPHGRGGDPDRETVVDVILVVHHGQPVALRSVLEPHRGQIDRRGHGEVLVQDRAVPIEDELERVGPCSSQVKHMIELDDEPRPVVPVEDARAGGHE